MTRFWMLPVLVAAAALAGCMPDVAAETASNAAFGSGTWSEVAPTGQNTLSGSAATIPSLGLIHFIGGYNGAAPVSNTWVYHSDTDSWSVGAFLATGVAEPGYAVVGGSAIWLLGGADGISTLTDIQT